MSTAEPDRAAGATWLFVPGDRPDRFDKAAAAGADHVILDLEDGVSPEAKSFARDAVRDWLGAGHTAWVRVNPEGTRWHDADVRALSGVTVLDVVLPQVESPGEASRLRAALPQVRSMVGLVESSRGVQRAAAIADSGHVDRLALGSVDLALDLGADATDEALHLCRTMLVLASRAAGLLGPLDGPTLEMDEGQEAGAAARRSRGLGFAGKLCIHPRQIAPVRAAFAPSPSEVGWASKVVSAVESRGGDLGAFSLDGEMVDRPVVLRARRILSQASPESRPTVVAAAEPDA